MKKFYTWIIQVVKAILYGLNIVWITVMAIAAIGIVAVIIASRLLVMPPDYYMGGMFATGYLFISFFLKFGWASGQQDRQLVKTVEQEHAASEEATLNTWGTGMLDFLRSWPYGVVCALLGAAFLYLADRADAWSRIVDFFSHLIAR